MRKGAPLSQPLVTIGPARHAYLITAYNNFEVVEILLQMIDDPRNDVFIHVDRSAKNFDPVRLLQQCKQSPVVFVPRMNVHWGHYSQIESILALFREATKSPHSHYHLLSGSDLPIKTQDFIHAFCAKNSGKEFVGFSDDDFQSRTNLFYFFNIYRRPATRIHSVARRVLQVASSLSLAFQIRLGVKRFQEIDLEIKKGSDWYTITEDLALHLIENTKTIRRLFRFAEIPTEFYVQTMIWNSRFKDRIFNPQDEFASSVRLVDWSRGDPYVWRKSDLSELLRSDRLFARKFLSNVDMEIVEKIRDHIIGNSGAPSKSSATAQH